MLKKLLISLLIIFLFVFSKGSGVKAQSNYIDLKIMSFNLLYGNSTSATSPELAQYIVNNNIDIAFFQEVDVFDQNYDEPQMIINNLNNISNQYRYVFTTKHNSESGLMIISKYPLIKKEEPLAHRYRKLQTAVVQTPNGYFRVFNVHLNSPDDAVETCPALNDHLAVIRNYTDYPHVIVGDFNIQFNLKSYTKLCRGVLSNYSSHTCPVGGNCAISHKVAGSVVDYLFVQKYPLSITSGYIAQDINISDHFPLIAVFKVSGPQFKYQYDANLDQKFDILDLITVIQVVFGG